MEWDILLKNICYGVSSIIFDVIYMSLPSVTEYTSLCEETSEVEQKSQCETDVVDGQIVNEDAAYLHMSEKEKCILIITLKKEAV